MEVGHRHSCQKPGRSDELDLNVLYAAAEVEEVEVEGAVPTTPYGRAPRTVRPGAGNQIVC